MKRQVISLFFLLIISFQIVPLKSFFSWHQIELSQDIADDEVEKGESKSKKFESCNSLFLEYKLLPNKAANFILDFNMGQLTQGHSSATFIPPNFA